MEFYILAINKNEKQPQKLLKKTNFKSPNTVKAILDEDWKKIYNKNKCWGKDHEGLVCNEFASPAFSVLN